MSGFVVIRREALDHHVVGADAGHFRAWCWLIANACWKPMRFNIRGVTVTLERGQLCASRQQLADAWAWAPSHVERFLNRLETEQMIGRETGQGRTIITISNYSKYQDAPEQTGQPTGQGFGQQSDSNRTAKEQGNKLTSKKEGEARERLSDQDLGRDGKPYAFARRVIRLNAEHYAEWKARYHAIPDIDAELCGIDDWLVRNPDRQREWFGCCTRSLNRKHQEMMKVSDAAAAAGEPTNFLDHYARQRREEQAHRERQAQGSPA